MSTATATKEDAKFPKITVTLTLESAEELKVFRTMVGRDNTLPLWLKGQRSINQQECITLSDILNGLYWSVADF